MTTASQNQPGADQQDDVITLAQTGSPRQRGRFWRAFIRNRIALIGLIMIGIMSFSAAFAPFVAPHDPNAPNYVDRLSPPSREYPLGTDEFGRDILSRLIYGGRISLVIAFTAQAIAVSIGVTLGMISGWYGGWIDDVIMRITDALFSISALLFLIVWVAILGPSTYTIAIALGIIGWATDARMMRSQVLTLKEREFVLAAQAVGVSNVRIMLRHILPNAIAPSIVLASLGTAGVILTESTLAFLGLGVQIPTPSWGTMIDVGRNFTTTAWWYAVFPGISIMITVLGFNFIGDGLRDALDPTTSD